MTTDQNTATGQGTPSGGVVVCAPVTPERQIAEGWGRAPRVTLATVRDGAVTDWTDHAVGWDALHDTGTEGSHHARVARFLRDHAVQVVVAPHMGQPMANTIDKLGISVHLGASGDAEQAILRALA